MNELFKEILIKKKSTPADTLKKVGLIALTVLLALAGLMINSLFLFGAVAAGVVSYYLLSGLDLEYEYIYVDGDIDVDKIMNKQRRKKAGSYDLENLELMAPSNSHELDSYRSGQAKQIDYTSGEENVPSYTGVYSSENGRLLVKLELDEEIIADMRRKAPRKIKNY